MHCRLKLLSQLLALALATVETPLDLPKHWWLVFKPFVQEEASSITAEFLSEATVGKHCRLCVVGV